MCLSLCVRAYVSLHLGFNYGNEERNVALTPVVGTVALREQDAGPIVQLG